MHSYVEPTNAANGRKLKVTCTGQNIVLQNEVKSLIVVHAKFVLNCYQTRIHRRNIATPYFISAYNAFEIDITTKILRKLIATAFCYLTAWSSIHELYIQVANRTEMKNRRQITACAVNHTTLLKFPYSSTFGN